MTEAEQAFMTMVKMAGIDLERWDDIALDLAIRFTYWSDDIRAFPIVASTFEALTIERPELREHYDRAKEAWEASQ